MADRKPNLFIVGAPRCGTTALHDYLATHPKIFMSEWKEPHFFSTDLTEESDRHHGKPLFGAFRSEEQYAWIYRDAGAAKVLGDASVLYLYSKVAAQRIAGFNPQARIIVMLREPVAFLESLHARYVLHGEEDCASFVEALAREPARIAGRDIPSSVRVPSLLHYREMAKFAEQLQRYRDVFAPERIKVIVFDDFKADTERTYREVLEFADVGDMSVPMPGFAPRNPSVAVRFRWLTVLAQALNLPAVRLYSDPSFPRDPALYLPWLVRMLPTKATWVLTRAIQAVNQRPAPRLNVDESDRERLKRELVPEVERLSEMLDRDLIKLWGYGSGA